MYKKRETNKANVLCLVDMFNDACPGTPTLPDPNPSTGAPQWWLQTLLPSVTTVSARVGNHNFDKSPLSG